MDLNLLQTLKDKLVNAKEFTEVWNYFFDHFGENREFMALGERTRSEFLEAILGQIGGQLFHTDALILEPLFVRLAEQQFIHGACTINGRLVNIIYFEDVQVGMLALVTSFTAPETKLVRFSGRQLPRGYIPSKN